MPPGTRKNLKCKDQAQYADTSQLTSTSRSHLAIIMHLNDFAIDYKGNHMRSNHNLRANHIPENHISEHPGNFSNTDASEESLNTKTHYKRIEFICQSTANETIAEN